MDVMEVRQKLEEAEGDERFPLLKENEGLPFVLLFFYDIIQALMRDPMEQCE